MMMAAILLAMAAVDDWPAWRGPNRDGVSAEKGLPASWSADENVLWKVPVPAAAGSTPIVAGDRIFLTSPSADGSHILLLCYGTDGKPLWQKVVSKDVAEPKNQASASPTTDGAHVWAFGSSGDLVSFTLDGTEVWRVSLPERYGRFRLQFGMTTTPLLQGGVIYLQLIHSGGAWVVALDAGSGKEIWKAERKSDGVDECEHSYASIQYWIEAYECSHSSTPSDFRSAFQISLPLPASSATTQAPPEWMSWR